MSHSTASILGLKKIQYLNQNSYLSIEAEATKMAQSTSYLQRNAGNWYVHSQLLAGYTNENQILGAGSGLGNNLQTLAISLNKGWSKYGIKFQHIAQNPVGVINILSSDGGLPPWNDYGYGIQLKNKFKNILFKLNIDWVHSKNYQWLENNKASNLYLFFNTIYKW